jgi:hypothetical protein
MKRKKTDLIMKKFIAFLMILTLWAGITLQASRPIPSFKANVEYRANFQEMNQSNKSNNGPNSGEKGKRYMIVVTNVAGPVSPPISVWVYSLDGLDILGPYTLYGDDQISVPIDDRDWGTIIQCNVKCDVSVWTSADPQGGTIWGPPIE